MNALLGTLVFTIFVPGTFVIVLPILIGMVSGIPDLASQSVALLVGASLIVIGAGIYVWSATAFVREGKGTPSPTAPPLEFVATGPYRYVRNPIYAGELVFVIGVAAVFGSMLILIYASGLFVVLHLFVIVYEEPNLTRRFGNSYIEYLKQVDRWLPFRFIMLRESA